MVNSINEIQISGTFDLNFWASIASIVSLFFSIISILLILSLKKKIRNRRSLNSIIQNLTTSMQIFLRGYDIPSDLLVRVKSDVSDIKKFKYRIFNIRLYKLIKELEVISVINLGNINVIPQKINLIINEIENY